MEGGGIEGRLSPLSLAKQREKPAILNDVWRRVRGWLRGHHSTVSFNTQLSKWRSNRKTLLAVCSSLSPITDLLYHSLYHLHYSLHFIFLLLFIVIRSYYYSLLSERVLCRISPFSSFKTYFSLWRAPSCKFELLKLLLRRVVTSSMTDYLSIRRGGEDMQRNSITIKNLIWKYICEYLCNFI